MSFSWLWVIWGYVFLRKSGMALDLLFLFTSREKKGEGSRFVVASDFDKK
jgi:hypothetical protein